MPFILKCGAAHWWNSPEAKWPCLQANPTAPSADDEDYQRCICFEKQYVNDGGSVSVFGPGMVPGKNQWEKEFVWWYFSGAFPRYGTVILNSAHWIQAHSHSYTIHPQSFWAHSKISSTLTFSIHIHIFCPHSQVPSLTLPPIYYNYLKHLK